MLKPRSTWHWFFDNKEEALKLNLGQDMVFTVVFSKKELVPDAFSAAAFTVEDAALFETFWGGVESLELSSPRKTELVLNAVAAARFYKPRLPRSWFFQRFQYALTPEVGTLVQLKTQHSCEPFLVVENTGIASFCLLANDGEYWLDENKILPFSHGIKVMNDYLSLYTLNKSSGKSNYDLVG